MQEIFFNARSRVGTAWHEGKPYMLISLRGTTIWDVLSSHGREDSIKFLAEAMGRNEFLRDVVIDAAIEYCREAGVPEDRRSEDIAELMMRKDDSKCPVCGNEI